MKRVKRLLGVMAFCLVLVILAMMQEPQNLDPFAVFREPTPWLPTSNAWATLPDPHREPLSAGPMTVSPLLPVVTHQP